MGGGSTLYPPSGSETPKKPRRNRVKTSDSEVLTWHIYVDATYVLLCSGLHVYRNFMCIATNEISSLAYAKPKENKRKKKKKQKRESNCETKMLLNLWSLSELVWVFFNFLLSIFLFFVFLVNDHFAKLLSCPKFERVILFASICSCRLSCYLPTELLFLTSLSLYSMNNYLYNMSQLA